jgi:hypothetical protein
MDAQCGGLGPADPGAHTVLVRSHDAGLTWDPIATLEDAFWIWGWSADGDEALLWRYPTAGSVDVASDVIRWPSMVDVLPPVPQRGTLLTDHNPMLLSDDSVAWWTTEGLVDERGELILDFAGLDARPGESFEGSLSPGGQRLLLTWNVAGSPQDAPWRWTLFERAATGRYEPLQTLVQPEPLFSAVPYSWLDEDRVVIPANGPSAAFGFAPDTRLGYVPAVVDFRTGEVAAIAGFDEPDVVGRGNLVINVDLQ